MIMTRAVATSIQAVSPELIADPSAAAAGPAAIARMTGAAVTAARVRLKVDRVVRMHSPSGGPVLGGPAIGCRGGRCAHRQSQPDGRPRRRHGGGPWDPPRVRVACPKLQNGRACRKPP